MCVAFAAVGRLSMLDKPPMRPGGILLGNISELVRVSDGHEPFKVGEALGQPAIIRDAAVVVSGDRIAWVGEASQVPAEVRGSVDVRIDCSGKTVLPGFVDCHTHFLFGGSREGEFAARCEGKSYLQIASAGGGIMSTVRATRSLSEEALFDLGKARLDQMLLLGTTTVECKSGYGLELEAELRLLEVANRLEASHPVTVVPTFLGAHTVPEGVSPGAYLSSLINEMIPAVAEGRLARFCDVFCDDGAFTVQQARFVLQEGQRHGLLPKIHTDQFSPIGGAALAAEIGAVSADHLDVVRPQDIDRLAESNVAAVLLPGCVFYLGLDRYAPARRMVESQLVVALATDFNPGSCMLCSLPIVMTIACTQMHLSPYEAICASTLNAAYALGLSKDIGSVEVGKKADLVVLDAPSALHIPYQFGSNLVETVIKDGRVVVSSGSLVRGVLSKTVRNSRGGL